MTVIGSGGKKVYTVTTTGVNITRTTGNTNSTNNTGSTQQSGGTAYRGNNIDGNTTSKARAISSDNSSFLDSISGTKQTNESVSIKKDVKITIDGYNNILSNKEIISKFDSDGNGKLDSSEENSAKLFIKLTLLNVENENYDAQAEKDYEAAINNEKVIKAFDKDGDGKLTGAELSTFAVYAASTDIDTLGQITSKSIEDAIENIGKSSLSKSANNVNDVDPSEVKASSTPNSSGADKATSTPNSSGADKATSTPTSSTTTSAKPKTQAEAEKVADQAIKDNWDKDIKTGDNSKIESAKTKLEKIAEDGTTAEIENQLKPLKDDMETKETAMTDAYADYAAEIDKADEGLKTAYTTAKDKVDADEKEIEEKDKAIDEKSNEISKQEVTVTKKEDDVSAAKGNVDMANQNVALAKAALSDAQNIPEGKDGDTSARDNAVAAAQKVLDKANTELKTAKNKLEKAETELKNEQDKLKKLEKEKTDLETEKEIFIKGEYSTDKSALDAAEKDLADSSTTIKSLQDKYKNAETDYNTAKDKYETTKEYLVNNEKIRLKNEMKEERDKMNSDNLSQAYTNTNTIRQSINWK